jgi:hypothetical protein
MVRGASAILRPVIIPTKPPAKPLIERRTGVDRRQANVGAPNGMERRVGQEPRRVEVQEVDLSASDWAAFETGTPLRPKQPPAA